LDFFTETRIDVNNFDLVFEEFLRNKVVLEIVNSDGIKVNFEEDINALFKLLNDNKKEFLDDLK
jgi:hypothetical protein